MFAFYSSELKRLTKLITLELILPVDWQSLLLGDIELPVGLL